MGQKLEQEVKFHLSNPETLRKKLEQEGATRKQPRTLECNLRFDRPDRQLSASFQVLRLRQDWRSRLTYKGPNDPQCAVSARLELEVEVSDFSATRQILEALGYEVMVIYEKYRSAYLLGEVEISLDEMPFGNFMEIEGPDADRIRHSAETLGLDWERRIKASYLTLFQLLKEKEGLTMRDLTFEAFEQQQVTDINWDTLLERG